MAEFIGQAIGVMIALFFIGACIVGVVVGIYNARTGNDAENKFFAKSRANAQGMTREEYLIAQRSKKS